MLFTGDMTKEEEEIVRIKYENSGLLQGIDVLKAAHHGSHTASGDSFIKMLGPRYAVLSYRKNNRFGHPHKETIETLERNHVKLIKTPETGAVCIRPGKEGTVIESFRKNKKG